MDANTAYAQGRVLIGDENVELANQLTLEKQAAEAVLVRQIQLKQFQETTAPVYLASEKNAQLEAQLLGNREMSDLLSTQMGFDQQILDLEVKITQAQQAGNTALADTLNQQKDLVTQLRNQTLATQATTQGFGFQPGTTTILRALGQGITGIGYQDTAAIMATSTATGVLNERLYEQYKALEDLYNLQGRPGPWSSVAIMGQQKLLDEFYERQGRLDAMKNATERSALANYYTYIASGMPAANAPGAFYSALSPELKSMAMSLGISPEDLASLASESGGAFNLAGMYRDIQSTAAWAGYSGGYAAMPSTAGGTQVQIAQLSQQISIMQAQLTQLQSINSRLTPQPGSV
jgi:hypothetical protein